MDQSNEIRILENAVKKAFAKVQYPGSSNISAVGSIRHLEGEAIAQLLRGKTSEQVDLQFLKDNYSGDCSAILHFLSEPAFLYYYPSFLLISLKNFEQSDLLGLSSLYWFSKPNSEDEKIVKSIDDHRALFDSDQIEAIHAVFSYLQRRGGSGLVSELDEAVTCTRTVIT